MAAQDAPLTLPMVRLRRHPDELTICYRRYSSDLVGYLVTLVGDVGVAQYLAQDAFAALFTRWRSVEYPRAYLYMTATNLARSHWRRRQREERALSRVGVPGAAAVPEYDPWLWDLVQRLPVRLRTPVFLHYYADLPVDQVAQQMRLPVGTVKRRLHEARGKLLEVLEECRA